MTTIQTSFRWPTRIPKRAMLVYQGGIANVFAVDSLNVSDFGRNAVRLFQGDFTRAIAFATGLGAAGCVVRTAACNLAGDIANAHWAEYLEDKPFSHLFVDLSMN